MPQTAKGGKGSAQVISINFINSKKSRWWERLEKSVSPLNYLMLGLVRTARQGPRNAHTLHTCVQPLLAQHPQPAKHPQTWRLFIRREHTQIRPQQIHWNKYFKKYFLKLNYYTSIFGSHFWKPFLAGPNAQPGTSNVVTTTATGIY